MTVKCLSPQIKRQIAHAHLNQTANQKELAEYYCVSERTINRVLNEQGLATAVPRIQGEAYLVMQVLKKHNIAARELDQILTGQCYAKQQSEEAYAYAISS